MTSNGYRVARAQHKGCAVSPYRSFVTRRSLRARAGQALVEMALVMPVLLLFVMALVNFGRGYLLAITLESAAREGARLASDSSQSDAAVLSRIQAAASPFSVGGNNVSVCLTTTPASPVCVPNGTFAPRTPANAGQGVIVAISLQVVSLNSLLKSLFGFGNTITVTAVAETMMLQ